MQRSSEASSKKSTMTKLSRPILSTLIVLQAVMSLFAAVYVQAADKTSEPKVKVDDKSFKCITDMTPVRHFYVDNQKIFHAPPKRVLQHNLPRS